MSVTTIFVFEAMIHEDERVSFDEVYMKIEALG